MTAMLSVSRLQAGYGSTPVLRGVSIETRPGEIVALLGANGAGKTTLLRAIIGDLPSTEGSVELDGAPLMGRTPEEIIRSGVVLVPEGRQLFGTLTVAENLLLGGYALRRAAHGRRRSTDDLNLAVDVFPDLALLMRRRCDRLSGGQQQMVAIGRGLIARPRVLLLDEPSLGLAPLIVAGLLEVLVELRRRGTAILLVEQHASLALEHADRAYVLERGTITVSGTAASVAGDPRVLGAYLGRSEEQRTRTPLTRTPLAPSVSGADPT